MIIYNEAKCDVMWFEIGVKTFKVIFDEASSFKFFFKIQLTN